QGGGRLVHDEDGGIERQRLGDLDHLALGDRKVQDLRGRVDLYAKPVEAALRVFLQLAAVNEETAFGLARKIDVFGNTQVRNEVQFLMDDGDACGFRFKRGTEADRLAAILDRPAIGLIDAA